MGRLMGTPLRIGSSSDHSWGGESTSGVQTARETLTQRPASGAPSGKPTAVTRQVRLRSAAADRLYFAQVREDPLLEIEALRPTPAGTIVIVSSGGCTALSLLASGAGRVLSVDSNTTQNDLVELKAAAIRSLDPASLVGFLGGTPARGARRVETYCALRPSLSYEAARFWDAHRSMIARGPINAGVSERFIRLVAGVMQAVVHPPSRVDRLFGCDTLADQRELYSSEWNNRRWRTLFRTLLSRQSFDHAYDSRFFENAKTPGFADHFLARVEHALCEIPVASNYFLHHMLRGCYPVAFPGGVPPYLDRTTHAVTREGLNRLELIDGSYSEFLATCDDDSVDGFALSNICEWLDWKQISFLFSQILRVAKPGARVCFRNFVGHTEVPWAFRSVIVEDVDAGRAAIERDRSCLQSRIAICRVEK